VIFLAGLTILNKVRYLCRLSRCGVDPVVSLHLRNAADYRTPTLGPHGTKLGHSWYQWLIKSDLSGWFDNSKKGEVFGHSRWMAGLTILKKVRCLGIVGGCGGCPVAALHLRNVADYRLPTFGPHGTKLGHSWYQWIIKMIFLACVNTTDERIEVSCSNCNAKLSYYIALHIHKWEFHQLMFRVNLVQAWWLHLWFAYGHCSAHRYETYDARTDLSWRWLRGPRD